MISGKKDESVILIEEASFHTEKREKESLERLELLQKNRKSSIELFNRVNSNLGIKYPRASLVSDLLASAAFNNSNIPHDEMESQILNQLAGEGIDERLFSELHYLNQPIKFKDIGKPVMNFLMILPPSLIMGFGWLGWIALTTIGFLACNKTGDAVKVSTLSMTLFINTMAGASINYASLEKAGIMLSQAYGNKDYNKFRKSFAQAITISILAILVFLVPLMIFIEDILLSIGILSELASSVRGFYWKFTLTEIMRMVVDLLMVFISSQGIETSFFAQMVGNTVVSGSLMVYLCFYLGMDLNGLIYTIIFFHGIHLIIFTRVAINECDRQTIGLIPFSKILTGLWDYFNDWVKFLAGIWIEYLAWEITSLFAALTNDIHQIAAFGSMINVAYINCVLQIGLKFTARSRINTLIGQGYIDAAKRLFYVIFVGILALNMLLGIGVYFSREYIAYFYAGDLKETNEYLIKLLAVYSLGMSADPIYGLLSLVARTINHIWFSIILNTVIIIGMTGALDYILVKILHQNVIILSVSMYVTFAIVYGLMFLKFSLYKWQDGCLNTK